MVAPKDFAWSFVDVAVFDANRVCLAAGHDESLNKNVPVSLITRWAGSWSSKTFDFAAVSLCIVTHPERSVLVAGNEGTVIRWDAQDFSQEHIDTSPEGPPSRGNIREISTIGKHAYAVGMGRMVYRCEGPANWVRIDKSVRADFAAEPDAGFNSSAGFDENEIYAVGWDGEIWGCIDQRWTRFDSPTTLALHKVVCAPDGYVYALGKCGLIVRGRRDQWEVMSQDETSEDFWGACWFRGALYASTARGIFCFAEGKLRPVDTGIKLKPRADCFYRLSAIDGCIWSVGEKMVIRSTEGVVWDELPYS